MRIALAKRCFWLPPLSASSQTADAWVIVTSLSTPKPATMEPQIRSGRREHIVVLGRYTGEVSPASGEKAKQRADDQSEQGADQCRRGPSAEAVCCVQDDEHDRRRADQPGQK